MQSSILAAVLLAQPPVGAQDAPALDAASAQAARPCRVGLVLSSGGARALAHLGVLEVLDELHVPIDVIVGSEVGALVGGLHASGLAPHEITARLESREWQDALAGRASRRSESWRQRTNDRDYLLDLPIALGPDRIGLARGLLRTRWISWELSSWTLAVSAADRFDELPIPFRCLATEYRSGRPVALDGGDLSTAILASLATPLYYPPILVEGVELWSGAISDPLPIGVAQDLGCDVLVVVDSAPRGATPEDPQSFLDAPVQLAALAGERGLREQLARLRPGDVHIAPDVRALAGSDMWALSDAVAAGRAAAVGAAEELRALALDDDAWRQHVAARAARRPPLPVLAGVRIADTSGLAESVLLARLDSESGAQLEEGQVREDLLRLYGLDYHDRIVSRLGPREDGSADLLLTLQASRDGLWVPRAGVALEGVFGEDATFVLGGAFTLRPIGPLGAEWRNRIDAGSRILLFSEYWQPLDSSATWFVAPAVGFEQERLTLRDGDVELAEFDTFAFGARFDVGRTVSDWGEVRAGLLWTHSEADLAVGVPAFFTGGESEVGAWDARFTFDTFDSLTLPSTGALGAIEVVTPADFLGGDDISYLTANVDRAFTIGRTSFVVGAEFDTSLDQQTELSSLFSLGGFGRLSGLGRDTLSGAHAALGRVLGWYRFAKQTGKPRLFEVFAGGSLEAGNVWFDRDDIALSDLRWGGSVFLGVDTFLGPAFLGVGVTDPGDVAMFLTFGRIFGEGLLL